jgi:hypothetical protein
MGVTSKYAGVNWKKDLQKYRASVTEKGVRYECGAADTEREAAILRDKKIIALGLDTKKLQILKPFNK